MKQKIKIGTILLIVGCFIGLSLLLYPAISDYWNRTYATHAMTKYEETVSEFTEEDYQAIWDEARQYNHDLYTGNLSYYTMTADIKERYFHCLSIDDSRLMGYIEIPKINVSLPIYHGTSDSVLQSNVGHLDWTSLPTGGENTHCVLSAHRGFPTARLFTDLDQLREGDEFMLNILNETLTYEVDQIRVVEPENTSDLMIVPEKDYCTLLTCTPYGINTHRMLVRGHRVETTDYSHVISEAVIMNQLLVAVFLSIPILFVLFMTVMLKKPQAHNADKGGSNP